MKLTTDRRRFLRALVQHGAISRLPKGVCFPSDIVLGQLEHAGYIRVQPVGPPIDRRERPHVTRRVEFTITQAGRVALEQAS